jgi:hypothetical protein
MANSNQRTACCGYGAATSVLVHVTSRTGRSRHTCTTACAASSFGVTSCRRTAAGKFARTRCSAHSACCACACAAEQASCREPAMKPVGKPDAGKPHVRFDERGEETDRSGDTAPLLGSAVNPCLLSSQWLLRSGGRPSPYIPSRFAVACRTGRNEEKSI